MKANLILKVVLDDNPSLIDPDGYLNLSLDTPKINYDLIYQVPVYDDDIEGFIKEIKDIIINDVEVIQNAIPGLKLVIDKSIVDFIPDNSEEIIKAFSELKAYYE